MPTVEQKNMCHIVRVMGYGKPIRTANFSINSVITDRGKDLQEADLKMRGATC